MNNMLADMLQVELSGKDQRRKLDEVARTRNWGLALLLAGWVHLVAFSFCYYLTIVHEYHGSAGYLLVWIAELCGLWLIFRLCGHARRPDQKAGPLEVFIRRVWIAYFLLAFNLGSLNTLRGHHLFEFFPAMASLATFALIMMSVVVDWRFFGAVVVMFCCGLLMAAELLHAYLTFAVAWWLVLNGIGVTLLIRRRPGRCVPEGGSDRYIDLALPRKAEATQAERMAGEQILANNDSRTRRM